MNRVFLLRLAIDVTATSLLLLALAYYWLGNTVHELAGTGLFLLIAIHNVFNRHWWAAFSQTPRQTKAVTYIILNMVLIAAVVTLFVTSVMISRLVFDFLPINGGFTAKQIHIAAAYWLLVIVSLHIGFRWSVVMLAIRRLFGINPGSPTRTLVLRVLALALVIYGIKSWIDLGVTDKLLMRITMDFWDFNASTVGFFTRLAAIVGLNICLTHSGVQLLQRITKTLSAT
ncbi:DUF4405 domain-containing protein [Rhizobium sp. NPDC090279]|uniref:DUF4405 domain-containing protein n=1 Tax=Rhizobium sp. NPDC090279 TaxID=3364499 RepID=UPI003839FDDC